MSADLFGALIFFVALVGLAHSLVRRASQDGGMLLIWAGLVVAQLDSVIRVPPHVRMLLQGAALCLFVAAFMWGLYRRRARTGPTA
jgi:hypothetical protein